MYSGWGFRVTQKQEKTARAFTYRLERFIDVDGFSTTYEGKILKNCAYVRIFLMVLSRYDFSYIKYY